MRDEDTGAVPVVENGRPVGMVTDRDIVVRAVAEGGQLNRPVRDIVSGGVVSASPEMSHARGRRADERAPGAPAARVENERLVGIVSLGDLAVKEGKDKRVGDTLQEISEGVKERLLIGRRPTSDVQQPERPRRDERQHDDDHDRDERQPRAPLAFEQRALGRRLDARLGRRVAASIADQRLVGDFGSAVRQIMKASGSGLRPQSCLRPQALEYSNQVR